MRILHTASTYAPLLDGVAEVVRHLSETLAKRGHEVYVATRALPGQPADSILNGVRVCRFGVRGNLANGIEGDIPGYLNFVRSREWDVVVNHCLQTWTTDALLEDLGGFSRASILVTHGLCTASPAYDEYYGRMVRLIPRFSRWVTVSALNEEGAYATQHGLPRPVIIRNGVDLQEWNDSKLGMRRSWGIGSDPWLVNVSNHSYLKGHRQFFQLAGHFKKTNEKFTVVGNSHLAEKWQLGGLGIQGGCYYECRLRSVSSEAISLKTRVSRPAVVSAIQEADILVSTSSREANSLVLLESMAAGTPWVSFDVGSASENVGGIVVKDLDEMTEAVKGLLKDPERRRSLGQEGRARAIERHDWVRIADQYEELYEATVGQRV